MWREISTDKPHNDGVKVSEEEAAAEVGGADDDEEVGGADDEEVGGADGDDEVAWSPSASSLRSTNAGWCNSTSGGTSSCSRRTGGCC